METMKCIIIGGSGEVGGAVARALIKNKVCSRLTMIGRRTVTSFQNEAKVKQFVVDTNSPDFAEVVKEIAQGHDAGISCIGIGSGTASMSEEQMTEVEVTLVGNFARGCKAASIEIFELLTAVGVKEASADSKIKYYRVLGKKHKTVLEAGFNKLAVFKPGVIVGNAHTPHWMTYFTRLVPDSFGWGNIHQEEIGRAFAAHLEKRVPFQQESVIAYGNMEMKRLISE